MSEQRPGSIGGGWLGTYAYKGAYLRPPVRFEATFAAPGSDGRFTGSILDDGELGEADIKGEQSGLGFRFTKTYRKRGKSVVSYEGTLAEDGETMTGTWEIGGLAHGVWDARRAWTETSETEAEETTGEYEENWEHPRVREVVRLG